MKVSLTVQVIPSGPFFDGGINRAASAGVDEASVAVSQTGVKMVVSRLGNVLVNPTGRYVSQIQTDRSALGPVITDGGAVYGPWLEGVDSRNTSSRFKGYATFRKTSLELEAAAGRIADPIIDRRVSR